MDSSEKASSMTENEQVEFVFLKFGLAESDKDFENLIHKFLPYLLQKLTCEDYVLKTKVIRLLGHIKARLTTRPDVQLPVSKLLDLYMDTSSEFIVVNFSFIYIKLGYPRLRKEDQEMLASKLFDSIEGKKRDQQDASVWLLVSAFPCLKLPENPAERSTLFNFERFPASKRLLLDFCLDVLLMPYSTREAQSRPASAPATPEAPTEKINAGLSKYAMRRLMGDDPKLAWTTTQIEQYKVSIVNLIGGDVFPENDVIVHLIIASSDTKSSVSSVADIEIKKRHRSLDWEKPSVTTTLYRLYLGDNDTLAPAQKQKRPPGSLRKPVELRVKLKIVQNLLRSKVATEQIPYCIQLVYQTLFNPSSSPKLRALGQEFIHHVCEKCDIALLTRQAPMVLNALLRTTKWLKSENRCRGLGYTAMGKLSLRVPSIFTNRIDLIEDTFEALSKESSREVKLHIQECLAMMSTAYQNVNSNELPLVEKVIEAHIKDSDHLCRLSAVRYAGKVFSSDHITSRYLLLLAVSDGKEDVASEAKKLLFGGVMDSSENTDNSKAKKLPTFANMLNFVYSKAMERMESSDRCVIGIQSMAFLPSTFSVLLQYLRKCLIQDACSVIPHDTIIPGEPITEAHIIAEYFRAKCLENKKVLEALLAQYIELTSQYAKVVTENDALYILLETIATSPETVPLNTLFGDDLENKLPWIIELAYHTRESVREIGAELHAIVLRYTVFDNMHRLHIMKEIDNDAHLEKNYEKKHGSLLLIGYLLQLWLNGIGNMCPKIFMDAFATLIQNATSADETLASAACFAIGEVARSNRLPMLGDQAKSTNDVDMEKDDDASTSKVYPSNPFLFCQPLRKSIVLDTLLHNVKSSSPHKLREKSVIAIGYLAVGDPKYFQTEKLLNALLNSAEIKEPELHFTVGRALANAALGPKSNAGCDKWQLRGSAQALGVSLSEDKLPWLMNKILDEYVTHRIPAVRQAASIWLLTLLKIEEVATHPGIQTLLTKIQGAFMALLTEADDLVQDIASKGLGVVYELGSQEQKKQLVDGLVGSLMEGNASKPSQSNLFHGDKGIGKAPDGSNLSTYKEICSLASDLNKPDLVYKFMHLAKHHALWNSKKGAAFGFSNIANLASEQLAPHLPRIVPRLYRYTFDPYTSVRTAMTSIWNSISPDPKKLVDNYLNDITIDLKKNLESSLWRTRQACCLAVADLLRGGRGMQKGEGDIIINALPEFWYHCLRLMDDIKGSVRDAAQIACNSLKKATIRLCDHEQGKQGEKAVTAILPVFLKDGLTSRVEDVKSLSLSVLVEVSKKSGKLIKGCVPEMVVALLHALSSFEPPELNYLVLRSDQNSRQAIDRARASFVKSSPMLQTIGRVLQYTDKQTLELLVPSLIDIIKKNYGIMTKAGCSHVIISLVTQCPQEVAEFASTLTSSLSSGLLDNSIAIRKCNADAIGHLAKVAKETTITKLFNKLQGWYLEKEDEIHHHASAITFHCIGKHSPDVLRGCATVALPLAFLGMHETVVDQNGKELSYANSSSAGKEDMNSVRYLWNDLWNEFTPGLASAIKLYLEEIIIFTSSALQSSQWKMKAQAAAAMETVARQQREGTITGSRLQKLLEILMFGLQGRTWDGKKKILTALSAITIHCKSEMSMAQVSSVLSLLFKECKRENVVYKAEAIHSLGKVLEAHKIDKFTHFWDILHPILTKDATNKDSSSDEEGGKQVGDAEMNLLDNAIGAVGRSWPHDHATQDEYYASVTQSLIQHISHSTRNIQLTSLRTVKMMFRVILSSSNDEKMETDCVDGNVECSRKIILNENQLLQSVCESLSQRDSSRVIEEALSVIQVIVKLFEKKILQSCMVLEIVKALQASPLFGKRSMKKTIVDELIQKLQTLDKQENGTDTFNTL